MGYAWNGICYQDANSALAAFAKDVPKVDATGLNAFTAAPTINASGVISWSISNRPLTDTTATVRTGTTQLQTCAESDLSQWPIQSHFFYAALFFAAFLGFRTGFRP